MVEVALEELGLLGAFLLAFALNLVPFAGPSNLIIAANVAALFPVHPLAVGFLVALGSATAKLIHYLAMFLAQRALGSEKSAKLDVYGRKLAKGGHLVVFIAIFVVAVTPIPDEPVILPLGLARYSVPKFYLSYLSGKFVIGVSGAYFGKAVEPIIGGELLVAVSIILTVVIALGMVKLDVEKSFRKLKSALHR